MTEKELKKLNRQELLEVLLAQSKKIDRLQAQLKEAQEKLNRRELDISEAGSIAQASLALNNVFADAQKAADQYLENIRRMQEQTERECAEKKAGTDKQVRRSLIRAKDVAQRMIGLYADEVMKRMKRLKEWDKHMEALRERDIKKQSAKPEE